MIRGQKVMLSTDLAELYRVEPKVLVQAVKRNNDRFPKDFMFQLSNEEFKNLKSQFVTSSWGVFDAIRNLMTEKQPDMRKQIGFRVAEKKHT